jgi:hypothetical protein
LQLIECKLEISERNFERLKKNKITENKTENENKNDDGDKNGLNYGSAGLHDPKNGDFVDRNDFYSSYYEEEEGDDNISNNNGFPSSYSANSFPSSTSSSSYPSYPSSSLVASNSFATTNNSVASSSLTLTPRRKGKWNHGNNSLAGYQQPMSPIVESEQEEDEEEQEDWDQEETVETKKHEKKIINSGNKAEEEVRQLAAKYSLSNGHLQQSRSYNYPSGNSISSIDEDSNSNMSSWGDIPFPSVTSNPGPGSIDENTLSSSHSSKDRKLIMSYTNKNSEILQ